MRNKDSVFENNRDEFSANYQEDILLIEKETEKRVSITISSIESALASWKIAKKKPPSMKTKIKQLIRFHNDLLEWQNQTTRKNDHDAIMKHLQSFVDICAKHKKNFGGAV